MALTIGEVSRPRIGWVALPTATAAAVRAVALGGRLGSGNALAARGLWVDEIAGLVVHVPRNASRLAPLRRGERRTHRQLRFSGDAINEWCVSVPDALIQLSHEVGPVAWLTSVDSALHHGAMQREVFGRMAPGIPPEHRRMLALADGRAESGNETRFRLLLIGAGYSVEIQVKIPLVGRIDLLVDGWLIVEIDSQEHHGTGADQERDRLRDGNALLIGLAAVRFMPEAVRNAPDWCLEVVRARLRHGRPARGTGRDAVARRVLP